MLGVTFPKWLFCGFGCKGASRRGRAFAPTQLAKLAHVKCGLFLVTPSQNGKREWPFSLDNKYKKKGPQAREGRSAPAIYLFRKKKRWGHGP